MKLFGTRTLPGLLGITILAFAIGCSPNADTRQVSGDITVRVPWAAEGGVYSLQEILLQGISSLYELSGQFVTFYASPSVQGSKITGRAPKTRFLKSGNVWVPQDTMTQQMTVIYAHMQRLAALDEKMGAGTVNTWPRDVGVAVRYSAHGSVMNNNAFYDGLTDSILIVPYTDEHLPIPVNAGILGHEHFHSLYFKLVEKNVFKMRLANHGEDVRSEVLGSAIVGKDEIRAASKIVTKSDSEIYHSQFSGAINEGLADFWAWIYTGDADFLASSLPSEKASRSLHGQSVPTIFMTAYEYDYRLKFGSQDRDIKKKCGGDRVKYCLGTDFAILLKSFSGVVAESRVIDPIEARAIIARAVIKALPVLSTELEGRRTYDADKKEWIWSESFFEPVKFFAMVQNALENAQEPEKVFVQAIINKTLERAKKLPDPGKDPNSNVSSPDDAPSPTPEPTATPTPKPTPWEAPPVMAIRGPK